MKTKKYSPIGVFDSGYGGLTILKEIEKKLPQYDFLYIGDNARTPYGNRSFETIYEYTLQAIKTFFELGCELVIIACNTASAKALRTIQQIDLPKIAPNKRVLGVIRPSVEAIGAHSFTKHVGVLGTQGTINSKSYVIEITKFFPDIIVHQESCPMWVPLIENNQYNNEGGDYFIKHHVDNLLNKAPQLDTIILGCTHYPILLPQLTKLIPNSIKILSQGAIVAEKLEMYLNNHPEIDQKCSKGNSITYYTTDNVAIFNHYGSMFMGKNIASQHINLLK